jgi:hypothetical protein
MKVNVDEWLVEPLVPEIVSGSVPGGAVAEVVRVS